MSETRGRTPVRRFRAPLALAVLAAAMPTRVGRCVEPAGGRPSASSSVTAELAWQFEARKRLDAMGLRGLIAIAGSPASAGAASAGMGANVNTSTYYRTRVVAPALAFLHGLCDSNGGLPRFGSTMDFVLRSGSVLELRASYLGEIATADGRPSGTWIWDLGRLPENVRAVRGTGAATPR